ALARILSIVGGIYLLIEMLDFFGMYTRDHYASYSFFLVFAFAVVLAIAFRRPVSRISYKIPKRDFSYEVIVRDILDTDCSNVIISTNTRWETAIANGLIAPDSIQGQLTRRYFDGNTSEMDRQIEKSLKGIRSRKHPNGSGKKKRYPIGPVAKVG